MILTGMSMPLSCRTDRWNNAKRNLKPEFYGNNELKYSSLSDKNIFPGGNEFRYFDIKSIRYQSEYVRKIDFLISNYHVYLFPLKTGNSNPISTGRISTGNILLQFRRKRILKLMQIMFMYILHFLPNNPVEGGRMYVSGAFNNWSFDNNNLMTYNPEKEAYECYYASETGLV